MHSAFQAKASGRMQRLCSRGLVAGQTCQAQSDRKLLLASDARRPQAPFGHAARVQPRQIAKTSPAGDVKCKPGLLAALIGTIHVGTSVTQHFGDSQECIGKAKQGCAASLL